MLKAAAVMARKKHRFSKTRRLHRSLGAGAALFIVFMALSGLAINHSNGLGLDRQFVSQPWLLDWFGLEGPQQVQSFKIDSDWLSAAGSQLYLNDKRVAEFSNIAGVVRTGEMLVVAGSDEWLLLDQEGQLIERQAWELPAAGQVELIGLSADGSVIVRAGQKYWGADDDLVLWRPATGVPPVTEWSAQDKTPDAILKAISRQYRGEGLSMERVLLDFHSGRIFGPIGSLVYDLLAIVMGFLAISGLIFWLRGRSNGK